jgi:hypothetical protein
MWFCLQATQAVAAVLRRIDGGANGNYYFFLFFF